MIVEERGSTEEKDLDGDERRVRLRCGMKGKGSTFDVGEERMSSTLRWKRK